MVKQPPHATTKRLKAGAPPASSLPSRQAPALLHKPPSSKRSNVLQPPPASHSHEDLPPLSSKSIPRIQHPASADGGPAVAARPTALRLHRPWRTRHLRPRSQLRARTKPSMRSHRHYTHTHTLSVWYSQAAHLPGAAGTAAGIISEHTPVRTCGHRSTAHCPTAQRGAPFVGTRAPRSRCRPAQQVPVAAALDGPPRPCSSIRTGPSHSSQSGPQRYAAAPTQPRCPPQSPVPSCGRYAGCCCTYSKGLYRPVPMGWYGGR